MVQQAPIIAIGMWGDASERRAVLRVDEGLKGVAAGDSLVVDNRTAYTAAACSPYDEPFHEGFRFAAGERSVVMLQLQVGGLWQVANLGLAAWPAPIDDLEPLPGMGGYRPAVSLDGMRQAVRALAHAPLNLESDAAAACNLSWFDAAALPRYAAGSTFAGIVRAQTYAASTTEFVVQETWRGRPIRARCCE